MTDFKKALGKHVYEGELSLDWVEYPSCLYLDGIRLVDVMEPTFPTEGWDDCTLGPVRITVEQLEGPE